MPLIYLSSGLFLLRLVVAIIFVVHALPKLQKPEAMAAGMNWPKNRVQALGIVEILGALSIVTGIYDGIGALLLAGVMIGAIYFKTQKWHTPFKSDTSTGWEFDLLLLVSALTIAGISQWF